MAPFSLAMFPSSSPYYATWSIFPYESCSLSSHQSNIQASDLCGLIFPFPVFNRFSPCSIDWFLHVRTWNGRSWPLVAVPSLGNVLRGLKSKGKRHLGRVVVSAVPLTVPPCLSLHADVAGLCLFAASLISCLHLFLLQGWIRVVWAEMVQVFESWPKLVLYSAS